MSPRYQGTGSQDCHRPLEGRDGRVIWKTMLLTSSNVFDRERDRGDSHEFATFPSRTATWDGDGTADVLSDEAPCWPGYTAEPKQPARLPLQTLSGRTGRPLWSAGQRCPRCRTRGICADRPGRWPGAATRRDEGPVGRRGAVRHPARPGGLATLCGRQNYATSPCPALGSRRPCRLGHRVAASGYAGVRFGHHGPAARYPAPSRLLAVRRRVPRRRLRPLANLAAPFSPFIARRATSS